MKGFCGRCEFEIPLDYIPAKDLASRGDVCRRCSAVELEQRTRDRYVEIKAVRGQIIKVSPEDADWARQTGWSVDPGGYPTACGVGRKRLHILIAKPPTGLVTDHINRDKLDNRRENLWVGTHVDNARNTGLRPTNKSGAKGVFWSNRSEKWTAQFTANGKVYHVGLFSSVEDAAAARLAAQIAYHTDTSAFLTAQESRRLAAARANFKKASDVRYGRAVPKRRSA